MISNKEAVDDIFDSPTLSDCELSLTLKNESRSVHVSRYYLSNCSPFFRVLFEDTPPFPPLSKVLLDLNPPPYPIPLSLSFTLNHAIETLRMAYQSTRRTLILSSTKMDFPDLLIVLQLAHSLGLKGAVRVCVEHCVTFLKGRWESPSRDNNSTDTLVRLSCNCLCLGGALKEKQVKKELLPQAKRIILDRFKNVREVVALMNEFLELPFLGLLVLLDSDEFVVDSENSVFYLGILWVLKDITHRSQFMASVLSSIRFPQMKKYYLVDVVPFVAEMFSGDTRMWMMQLHNFAVEYKLDPVRYEAVGNYKWAALHPRKTFADASKITFKCQYNQVSSWDLDSRQYSSPIFAHGYELYYFLRKQRVKPGDKGDPKNFTLAGFLRCTSKLLPAKHYLPICSTVKIPLRGNSFERRFSPSKVVFEASEKAIGGKLTIADETWDQITSGANPMVIDNCITIYVTVEFLEEEEGCQIIEHLRED